MTSLLLQGVHVAGGDVICTLTQAKSLTAMDLLRGLHWALAKPCLNQRAGGLIVSGLLFTHPGRRQEAGRAPALSANKSGSDLLKP